MILNGIFALASRYDARRTGSTSELESTYYHMRCIEQLRQAFDAPPETWDVRVLIAAVFARLYEEYDNESDSHHHHLDGTRELLNHEVVARSVLQGGLAEAVSWVHLRQAIYVCLVGRQPVQICLRNFQRSSMFDRKDDSAQANRMVFLFARALKLYFVESELPKKHPVEGHVDLVKPNPDPFQDSWELLEYDITHWHENKPVSFNPILHEPADSSHNKPFPIIWMIASVPGLCP